MSVTYRPRNDYVLIKIIDLGKSKAGVLIPEICIEGKEFHVLAKGPDVQNLEVGDKVLCIGKKGEDYGYLPARSDVFLTKQANCVLIFDDGGTVAVPVDLEGK